MAHPRQPSPTHRRPLSPAALTAVLAVSVAPGAAWTAELPLESDLIHGRRADARDLDWMLHVNPALRERGLLVVFNPLTENVERSLRVNLYYTGLANSAQVREADGPPRSLALARDYTVDLPVRVPAGGLQWYVFE